MCQYMLYCMYIKMDHPIIYPTSTAIIWDSSASLWRREAPHSVPFLCHHSSHHGVGDVSSAAPRDQCSVRAIGSSCSEESSVERRCRFEEGDQRLRHDFGITLVSSSTPTFLIPTALQLLICTQVLLSCTKSTAE